MSCNVSASSNAPTQTKDDRRRPRILLGVTGSVAAVKAPEIALRMARDLKMDVKILLTRGGQNFWVKAGDYHAEVWNHVQQRLSATSNSATIPTSLSAECSEVEQEGTITLHDSDEEWKDWHCLGDPVLHIDLRDWADALVIAPLSAHTLAKLANGLCDDTLSCVVRAWDLGHGVRPAKPLLLAPAMNTAMWQHPLTKQQLTTIQAFWKSNPNDSSLKPTEVTIIQPQIKTLACGEIGNGALASVDEILEAVQEAI